jgi:replication factor C subunit 2/4
MLRDGFPALQILTQLADFVVASAENSDAMKARVCARIAEADKALVDGADESLQIAAVVSVACQALGKAA